MPNATPQEWLDRAERLYHEGAAAIQPAAQLAYAATGLLAAVVEQVARDDYHVEREKRFDEQDVRMGRSVDALERVRGYQLRGAMTIPTQEIVDLLVNVVDGPVDG